MKACLFDFNGVLVDDEYVHCTVLQEMLKPLQIEFSTDWYASHYLAYDDRTVFRKISDDFQLNFDEARIESLTRQKLPLYLQRVKTDVRVYDGAFELLAEIARVVPVCIVSGAHRDEIESILATRSERHSIRAIVACDDVIQCKPHPEGYLRALTQLAMLESTTEVVVIEDSIAGVKAGVAAGCCVVAVEHSFDRETLKMHGAVDVIPHIRNISVERLQKVCAAFQT